MRNQDGEGERGRAGDKGNSQQLQFTSGGTLIPFAERVGQFRKQWLGKSLALPNALALPSQTNWLCRRVWLGLGLRSRRDDQGRRLGAARSIWPGRVCRLCRASCVC